MGVRPGGVTYRRQRNNAPVICDTVAHASRHGFVDPRDTGKYIYRRPGVAYLGRFTDAAPRARAPLRRCRALIGRAVKNGTAR